MLLRLTALFITSLAIIILTSVLQIPALSPLIVAIVSGTVLGNLLNISKQWQGALAFAGKPLLRAGIVFYGLQISISEVLSIGSAGLGLAAWAVTSTFIIALLLGRWLGLDRTTAALVGAGTSICGAAAVLATESTIKARGDQSAIAIATVVVFGTISMFILPLALQLGWISLPPAAIGIWLGASIHEVAQVIVAGSAFDTATAQAAVLTKMLRVILLVPFLLALGILFVQEKKQR